MEKKLYNAICVENTDNVVVVTESIQKGQVIRFAADHGAQEEITALEDIPVYHKAARYDISPDAPVLKYGNPIGKALRAIARGTYVHVHNLGS